MDWEISAGKIKETPENWSTAHLVILSTSLILVFHLVLELLLLANSMISISPWCNLMGYNSEYFLKCKHEFIWCVIFTIKRIFQFLLIVYKLPDFPEREVFITFSRLIILTRSLWSLVISSNWCCGPKSYEGFSWPCWGGFSTRPWSCEHCRGTRWWWQKGPEKPS